MENLNFGVLIGAAIIDSINPCAFGVLIFLLAYLTKTLGEEGRRRMFTHAMVYISAVFITYLIAGLLLLPAIQALGGFSVWSYVVIAAIVIFAGLLELKDVIWYGKGPSLAIDPKSAKRIQMYIQKVSDNYVTSFLLGVFVAVVELPCTGAVYLAVLAMMSVSGVNMNNVLMLILYNFIFVAPLIGITWFISRGASSDKFEEWRKKHRKLMRLGTGLLLLVLGGWMMWYALM